MTMPLPIPDPIPGSVALGSTPTPTGEAQSLFDIAIGGLEFVYANDVNNPNTRTTAPFEKTRVDQETTPGEQTLTSWWLKSQESFHGGAGQLQLEPAVPTAFDHIRFDMSKNCDVWTPGTVTRLPDTTVTTTDAPVGMVTLVTGGVDAVVYVLSTGVMKLYKVAAHTFSTFTLAGVLAVATDGNLIYAATATGLYKCDPAAVGTSTQLYSYATATNGPVLGWVKSRLMLAVSAGVYELDVSVSAGLPIALSSTQLRYQHPVATFTWRCFAESPGAILAAGDANNGSVITRFTLTNTGATTVLAADGDIANMPAGEKVLSLLAVEGTFLVIGTNRGVRVGQYDSLYSNLSYGPLELASPAPAIPANALIGRLGFVYQVGLAYDEGGLIRINIGTEIDQAGRYAWAPDLICPVTTATPAVCGATLQLTQQILFSVPGTGLLLEGVGSGTGREAWLRTSRMRYDTTEPKLFKLGRVRGQFDSGTIRVDGLTPMLAAALVTAGPSDTDPPEFRLPTDPVEWLQLTFNIFGATTALSNYSVKALPGTRRQRDITCVVSLADSITTRNGQRVRDTLNSRDLLSELEELDAKGDEVVLQEFTPLGVVATLVVIQRMQFTQTFRPTGRSDLGGDISITMRTVE